MQARRLKEIRERLSKATAGKWEWIQNKYNDKIAPFGENGKRIPQKGYTLNDTLVFWLRSSNVPYGMSEKNAHDLYDYKTIMGLKWVDVKAEELHNVRPSSDNMDFISNSPTDIKFLLDALDQAQERERVLRDFIDTQFCQNFKKYGKSTMCHHPDNGLCYKYYDCMALNEALKEDKP